MFHVPVLGFSVELWSDVRHPRPPPCPPNDLAQITTHRLALRGLSWARGQGMRVGMSIPFFRLCLSPF
jgi:hypothetical protein